MADPVLASHARRGLLWVCRRGLHRWRLTSRSIIDGQVSTSWRCARCPAARHEQHGK